MKNKIFITMLTFLLSVLLVTGAYSSSKEIKKRMIARLPAINALKAKELVGENNKGFLEFIGDRKENEDLVKDENKDRRLVYQAIAKQQGTTLKIVGKHRAVQIAGKAKPGTWLQDATGKWYQKK